MPIPIYSAFALEEIKRNVRRVERMKASPRGESRGRKANDIHIKHQSWEHGAADTRTSLTSWTAVGGSTGDVFTNSSNTFTATIDINVFATVMIKAAMQTATGYGIFQAGLGVDLGGGFGGRGDHVGINSEWLLSELGEDIDVKKTFNIRWARELTAGNRLTVTTGDSLTVIWDVWSHLTLFYWTY